MHQLLLERGPLQIHLTYLFGHHITDFFHEVFYDILGQWLFSWECLLLYKQKGGGRGMGKHVFSSNKFSLLRNREMEGKKLLLIMPFKFCLLFWN
jgi:hypothetical protein